MLVNYNYLRNDFDYISGGVDLALLKPFYISYEQRYDLESETTLEEIARVELKGKCWSILVSYRDRPADEEINFEFSLSGLSGGRLLKPVTKILKNYF